MGTRFRAAYRGAEGVGDTWWALFAGEVIVVVGGGSGSPRSRRRQRGRERERTAAGLWREEMRRTGGC